MISAISSLFTSLTSLLIPPRRSEQIVAALSLADLEQLRAEDGLPYRDERVRAFVWELKYNENPHALALAGEFLAEDLLGIAEEELAMPLLIPIPCIRPAGASAGITNRKLVRSGTEVREQLIYIRAGRRGAHRKHDSPARASPPKAPRKSHWLHAGRVSPSARTRLRRRR